MGQELIAFILHDAAKNQIGPLSDEDVLVAPHYGGNRPWGVWVEVAEFVFLSSVINHTRICPNCVSSPRQREREDVISALSKQAPRIRSQLEERIFAVRRSFWEFSWKTLVRRMFWGGIEEGSYEKLFLCAPRNVFKDPGVLRRAFRTGLPQEIYHLFTNLGEGVNPGKHF